jgi:UPF0755 protein
MEPIQEPNLLKSVLKLVLSIFLFLVIVLTSAYFFVIKSPSFTPPVIVTIEPGQSTGSVTKELKEKNIIRSSSFAETLVILFGGSRKIHAGIYEFKESQNIFSVVSRIVNGELGYTPVKLTIPEGTDTMKLAEIIKQKFPNIDIEETKKSLVGKEGYLFPDTYFFAPFTDSLKIEEKMRKTFDEKIKPLDEKIKQSGRSLDDVIKLASILEEEVRTKEDMGKVADIMLRRMSMGMPLQVDCTLKYVLHKTSAQLTIADLKADGPYNTYTRKGLPETPISNPGLASIEAALNPIPNPYVFYLSDKDGITHFAKTYEEHLQNKRKYLK